MSSQYDFSDISDVAYFLLGHPVNVHVAFSRYDGDGRVYFTSWQSYVFAGHYA